MVPHWGARQQRRDDLLWRVSSSAHFDLLLTLRPAPHPNIRAGLVSGGHVKPSPGIGKFNEYDYLYGRSEMEAEDYKSSIGGSNLTGFFL